MIDWRASFEPKQFGTGWFWRLFMAGVLATTARRLAAAAEDPNVLALLPAKNPRVRSSVA